MELCTFLKCIKMNVPTFWEERAGSDLLGGACGVSGVVLRLICNGLLQSRPSYVAKSARMCVFCVLEGYRREKWRKRRQNTTGEAPPRKYTFETQRRLTCQQVSHGAHGDAEGVKPGRQYELVRLA